MTCWKRNFTGMEKVVINRNRQLKNHTLYAYDKLKLISNRSWIFPSFMRWFYWWKQICFQGGKLMNKYQFHSWFPQSQQDRDRHNHCHHCDQNMLLHSCRGHWNMQGLLKCRQTGWYKWRWGMYTDSIMKVAGNVTDAYQTGTDWYLSSTYIQLWIYNHHLKEYLLIIHVYDKVMLRKIISWWKEHSRAMTSFIINRKPPI